MTSAPTVPVRVCVRANWANTHCTEIIIWETFSENYLSLHSALTLPLKKICAYKKVEVNKKWKNHFLCLTSCTLHSTPMQREKQR